MYGKGFLGNVTENLHADYVQSRQAGFMQCFLIIACIPRLCQAVFVERPDQTQKIKHTRAFLVCFTMEEIIQCKWSGLRGSNSLPPPWQGGALPDELNPHLVVSTILYARYRNLIHKECIGDRNGARTHDL